MIKKFQTSFWPEEHRWYIEYSVSRDCVHVYTIPFISKTFSLTSNIERHYDGLTNNSNAFDNVTNLIIRAEVLGEKCDNYFSNVTSLEIDAGSRFPNYLNYVILTEHIQKLETLLK
jgi:hypothetical protein